MMEEVTSTQTIPDLEPAGSSSAEAQASSEFDVSLVVVVSNTDVDLEAFTEMVDTFRRVFHQNEIKGEFIVVDDGVGGGFFDAARVLNREIPDFRVIRFRRTFGESVALRIACERARGAYIVTNTWYLQVKPEAVKLVVQRLRSGADYVAARRTPRVDSSLARLQSFVFNKITEVLTGVKLNDLNCSFRGFKREVIDEIHFHGDLFRFVPILAIGQGFRVEELDVTHVTERGPGTFLNFSLYIRRLLDIFSLFFLMKFIKKPLRFFGLTGITFFVIGSIISGWITYEKLFKNVGAVDRPLLVLGVFLMVLGPILLSIGLIGEIIIFTQGRHLSDYHIDTILTGRDRTRDEEQEDGNVE